MTSFLEFTEDVRRASDIVDVIGADAQLERTSGGWKCRSPLRADNDPSFWIYPKTQSWCDFGTREGGDVFKYIQKRDNCDFAQAVLVLARRAGLTPPWSSADPLTQEAMSYVERRAVQELQTEAIDYYFNALPDRIRREYFHHQYGFTNETIDELRLGWADGHLGDYFLSTRGYSREMCLKTGFFLQRANGELIDLFVNRLVFPYWHRGLAVYAIARRTEYSTDDDWEKPKYKKLLVHDPEKHPYVSTTVGNDWFWGEDMVGRRVEELVITEGITDAIAARQAGLPVISPVTVRFREKDLPKLLRLTERADKIIICNDADVLADGRRPGEEGALKTATALFQQKRDVRIAVLPRADGTAKIDLNEFLRDRGLVGLRPILDRASRYPEFLIQQIPDHGLDPAALEDQLKLVSEVVASTTPLQREAYTRQICRRFRLPKRTVQQMISAFDPPAPILTDEQQQAEQARAAQSRGPQEEKIRGRVFEDIAFYYTVSPSGAEEVISSFSLRAKQRISIDGPMGGELLCCDAILSGGRSIENVTFPRAAWTSRRDFLRALPSPDMQWKGSDDNVQDVLRLVTSTEVPTRRGTSNLGFYDGPDGPRWVWPGAVLGPDGLLPDPDVVFVPNGSTLPSRVTYEGGPNVDALVKEVLPALLKLNSPEVLLPILGWFFATPFKPRLHKMLGHFPILMVWGTQGSGKTSIIKEVFWPLFGVAHRTEPYSCTETEFALIRQFACTDSVPVFLDEFKPRDMGKIKVDKLLRLLRRVYGGETEERGRVDLTVASYNLLAPIVFAGESLPEGDPALVERMICVNPDKNYLLAHPQATALFQKLARSPLGRIAGPYVQWSLSRDVPAELEEARRETDVLLAQIHQAGKLPLRVYDNLLAMVFGLRMFCSWASRVDADIDVPDLPTAFRSLTKNILEGEGSNVKDAFDGFLEALSIYAHLGALKEGTHYVMIDGRLSIHLPSCHEVYLAQRRSTGRDDDTNGVRALKRVASEKQARGSYVVEIDKRVPLGEQVVRCIVIDMNKIPDGLEIERFPVQKERSWGGPREGSGRWGWGRPEGANGAGSN